MMVMVNIDAYELLQEIDIEELFDEIGEKRLKAYLEKRRINLEKRRINSDIFASRESVIADLFAELRRAIQLRDLDEVTAILDSYERPKWRTLEACEKDFRALRKAQ